MNYENRLSLLRHTQKDKDSMIQLKQMLRTGKFMETARRIQQVAGARGKNKQGFLFLEPRVSLKMSSSDGCPTGSLHTVPQKHTHKNHFNDKFCWQVIYHSFRNIFLKLKAKSDQPPDCTAINNRIQCNMSNDIHKECNKKNSPFKKPNKKQAVWLYQQQ